MPIEKRKGETRDEFISRCIKVEIDNGKENDQAVAICISKADQEFATVGERGGIVSSPKAPKSNTPNKNPKGEGTAKGDASNTKGAEVSARVEAILADKVKEFNDRYKDKIGYGATIGQLKSVYQRGVGAFNVSHSPKVQSAEQWALARVNAFLYILKNGRPENPKYTNDFDLLPKKHPKSPDHKKENMAETKTSFDFDGVLSTKRGQDLYKSTGGQKWVITARSKTLSKSVYEITDALNIPRDRVIFTGSNSEKIKKIKELGIDHHIDNNPDVISGLPENIGEKFASGTQSVSDATWSSSPAVSINLETYNDYPEAAKKNAQTALDWAEKNGWGDCGTPVGKIRANQLAKGENISEDTISRMAQFERHRQNSKNELGDGCGRLMWLAWGGDEGIAWAQRKLEQIRKQKSTNLAKVKKVLIDENVPDDVILDMKNRGFKVYIKSARKIKRADRKAYNRLKSLGLSADWDYVSGSEKDLDRQLDFSLYMSSEDPILDTLLMKSETYQYRQVLHQEPVFSIEDAEMKEKKFFENCQLKFATIRILYQYKVRPDVPDAISGSRPFVKN